MKCEISAFAISAFIQHLRAFGNAEAYILQPSASILQPF